MAIPAPRLTDSTDQNQNNLDVFNILDLIDRRLVVEKTTAPTVNDDAEDGHLVGTKWVDETNDLVYECVDNTVGAAVWIETSDTATVTGTTNEITVSGTTDYTVGIADNPVIPGTGQMLLPDGTTAQRITASNGDIRYNTDTEEIEGYIDSAWSTIANGGGVWAKNQKGWWSVIDTTTTIDGSGLLTNPSVVDSTSTSLGDADGAYFSQSTSATSGNEAYISNTIAMTQSRFLPFYITKFQISTAVTNTRFFTGLSNQSAVATLSSDDPAGDRAGLSYSSGVGTAFYFETKDSTTENATSTSVTATAGTTYYFAMKFISTSQVIMYLFDNSFGLLARSSITSNLPTSTNWMSCVEGIETGTTSVKTLLHYGTFLVHNV